MIVRAMIDILQATIVLHEIRAESSTVDGASVHETRDEKERRENHWTRRLYAARALAHVARRVGDSSKIYAPTCTAVSRRSICWNKELVYLTSSFFSIKSPFSVAVVVIIKELRRLDDAHLYRVAVTPRPPRALDLAGDSRDGSYVDQLKRDLESLLGCLDNLGRFFPGLREL